VYDEDPEITWLRHQVDQVFDGIPLARTADKIGLVAGLATSLAFLSLLVGLALIAPL
jgi:hypothetical protein